MIGGRGLDNMTSYDRVWDGEEGGGGVVSDLTKGAIDEAIDWRLMTTHIVRLDINDVTLTQISNP